MSPACSPPRLDALPAPNPPGIAEWAAATLKGVGSNARFGRLLGFASFSRHTPTRPGEAHLAALIARAQGILSIKDALTAIPFLFTAWR